MGPGTNSLLDARAWLVVVLLWRGVQSSSTCTSKEYCEERIGPGSVCRDDAKCTVPQLEKGCLQSIVPAWTRQRVCNSEDPPDAAGQGLCRTPDLLYTEIRLFGANWESRVFQTWLAQIILSELLDVPATVEGGPDATLNLYDSSLPLQYGIDNISISTEAYERGRNISDCSLASRDPNNYEVCAHGVLEVWDAGSHQERRRVYNGLIEAPAPIGMLGREAVFITKFTIENDTSLASYFGLRGEEQRQKLAEMFLRPTTWLDYCDQVSPNNCTKDDGVAKRYPLKKIERDRLFVEELYTGHFRATVENNCTLNNATFKCTGHIGDYPCGWNSYLEAQLHHLEIPLQSSGNEPNSRGYSNGQLVDMWHAANATKSNLMMFYWSPNSLQTKFMDSDAEMIPVMFRPPTEECLNHRVSPALLCHDSKEVRVGSPSGACETPITSLMKEFVSSLRDITNNPDDPVAIHSPAYEMLRLFQFSEYQLNDLAKYVAMEPSNRQALCRWAADNLDYLQSFVPKGYPRTFQDGTNHAFIYATCIIGGCVALLVFATVWAVHKYSANAAIRMAQVGFLQLLLAGALLLSIGAILTGMKPNNFLCIASIWFVNIGYTLELVPLIVKVGAICALVQAAQRMHRFSLDRKKLYRAVAIILFGVLVYLAIWTVLDPPQERVDYSLTGTVQERGETVVRTSNYCASESNIWEYVAVGWNVCLLTVASVLAFQMRRTHAMLNETATLAFLIYSHFMFVILRVATLILSSEESILRQTRSLIYSVDTLATILIYFAPKLLFTEKQGEWDSQQLRSGNFSSITSQQLQSRNFSSNSRQWIEQSLRTSADGAESVLVKSAEMHVNSNSPGATQIQSTLQQIPKEG